MANLFFSGFEKLVSAHAGHANIWDITTPANWNASTTTPRSGGGTYSIAGEAFARTAVKSLGGNYGVMFTGLAWVYFAAALPATPASLDFYLLDGTTVQIGWVVSGAGEIIVYRGSATIASATELGRSATGVIIAPGTGGTGADYKMIEMKVVFATGATGSVIIKVGDATVLTLTSVQTAASANAYANRFGIITRGAPYHIDDLYLNDDSGSAPENTFFGEAFVVEGIIPNGNGNSSQWVGSDGNSTDNYLLVDDTGNNDTDYIKSASLNDLDLHTLANLTNATGTVIGTNHYLIARKDDVAIRTIASVIRTNSNNYVGGNKTMTGTYGPYIENRLINPDTSLRFTIAEINALEAGEKVTT